MGIEVKRFIVVGAGPAGCSVALRLHQLGKHVVVFDPGSRPSLIVGESLLPSLIPILRSLDIEDAVRHAGILKKGVYLRYPDLPVWQMHFEQAKGIEYNYAYHIERRLFDAILQQEVERRGIPFYRDRLRCHCRGGTLRWESRDGTQQMKSGDFILDCSGRSQCIARTIDDASIIGSRDDLVLFAHHPEVELDSQEFLHMDVDAHGWVWRIPLPNNKTSIGGVYPRAWWESGSKRKRMQSLLNRSPLQQYCAPMETECCIALYSNYQRQSSVSSGENWALLGDAYGFLDPVFSSGLAIAMQSAMCFVEALQSAKDGWRAVYQQSLQELFSYWNDMIQTFYSGEFYQLIQMANDLGTRRDGTPPFIESIARVLSGVGTNQDQQTVALAFRLSSARQGQRTPRQGRV